MSPDLPVAADLETLRAIFAGMGEGVVLQHADGRIGLVNPAALRILGLTEGQILGRDNYDPRWRAIRQDGSDYPVEEFPTQVTLRTGEPAEGLMGVYSPAAADHRWILISANPFGERGEDGLPSSVIATFTDVSGRVAAEDALRAERDFSSAVIEAVRDPLVVAEIPTGRIMSVNSRALSLLGYSEDELVGAMPPWPFWPEEHLEAIAAKAEAAFRSPSTAGIMDHDRVVKTRDGERIPVIVSGAPIVDASGEAVALVMTYKDVRERAAAAATLRESEERFHVIAENTGDAIGVFQADMKPLFLSPSSLRVFGTVDLPNDNRGMPLVHPDDLDIVLASHRRAVSGETDVRLQWRAVRPDGRVIWIESTTNPIADADGNVGQVVVNARDVTERVTREAEEKALRRVTEAVARGASPEETLTSIAEEAGHLLAADFAGVIRYDEMPTVVGHWSRRLPDGEARPPVPSSGARTDLEWAHHNETDVAHFGVRAEDAGIFLREGVAAPVTLEGGLWGCISLIREQGGPEAFGPGAEARLARFAELAGLALEVATGRERLVRQARTDPLTGLPHSVVFHERLDQEVDRALRHGLPLVLVSVDIDGFRAVNDRHGHSTGDDVLAAIGSGLRGDARAHDVVARVGGAEFAVILPETDLSRGTEVAARILRIIADTSADIAPVTASAGVACLEEGDAPGTLLRRAGHALDRAKAAGGARHQAAPTRRERRLRPVRALPPLR